MEDISRKKESDSASPHFRSHPINSSIHSLFWPPILFLFSPGSGLPSRRDSMAFYGILMTRKTKIKERSGQWKIKVNNVRKNNLSCKIASLSTTESQREQQQQLRPTVGCSLAPNRFENVIRGPPSPPSLAPLFLCVHPP